MLRLKLILLWVTKLLFWTAVIAPLIFFVRWKFDEIKALDVLDLIQVISGVATTYGLIFLILGYRQQGKELAQNTQALRLQAEELRKSVEQAEELVKVTRTQLELEQNIRKEEADRIDRTNQPIFVIDFANKRILTKSPLLSDFLLPLINSGAQALNVSLEVDHQNQPTPRFIPMIETGQEVHVTLKLNNKPLHKITLTIRYRTLSGTDGIVYFRFRWDANQLPLAKRYDEPPPPLVDS